MKLKITNKRVLVKLDEPLKVSEGGLHIPETADKTGCQTGMVMEVAPDCDITIKQKDVVIVPRYSGSDIELGGIKYKLFASKDILAIIV